MFDGHSVLPRPENGGRMPPTSTRIKRTTSARAWQVVTENGKAWRHSADALRADAEDDARTTRYALWMWMSADDHGDRRASPAGRASDSRPRLACSVPVPCRTALKTAFLAPLRAVSAPDWPRAQRESRLGAARSVESAVRARDAGYHASPDRCRPRLRSTGRLHSGRQFQLKAAGETPI